MKSRIHRIQIEIQEFTAYFGRITEEDPVVFDYEIHQRLNSIDWMARKCSLDEHEALMQFCFQKSGVLDESLLNHHARFKPFKMAGDFLIIDDIYQQKVDSPSEMGRLWDEFLLRLVAAQAVVNRKAFLTQVIAEACHRVPGGLSVLNLACGGCRDMAEAVANCGDKIDGSDFHCIDLLPEAVAYGKKRVQNLPNVAFTWEVKNVFHALRVRPQHRYDLIWSAGLFDYLTDEQAIFLIRRSFEWTQKDGGQIVLGNFHPRAPCQNYMNWCLNWPLIYRDESDFERLFEAAEIGVKSLSFDQEPLGCCIFAIATC